MGWPLVPVTQFYAVFKPSQWEIANLCAAKILRRAFESNEQHNEQIFAKKQSAIIKKPLFTKNLQAILKAFLKLHIIKVN